MKRVQELHAQPPLTTAQAALVADHQSLAAGVASAVFRRGSVLSYDDLMAHGNEGLVQAAQNYDPSVSDATFATFAYTRVMGAMQNALARENKHRQRGEALGRLADALEMGTDYTEGSEDKGFYDSDEQASARARLSFDAQMVAAGLGYLSRTHPEDAIAERQLSLKFAGTLRQAIAALPEREQHLIEQHYQEGVELIEIGRAVGVSRATIYRRHTLALERLADSVLPALRAMASHEGAEVGAE